MYLYNFEWIYSSTVGFMNTGAVAGTVCALCCRQAGRQTEGNTAAACVQTEMDADSHRAICTNDLLGSVCTICWASFCGWREEFVGKRSLFVQIFAVILVRLYTA